MTRQDGLGWCYGKSIGAYGQMHCISMILQGMRDHWVAPEKHALYLDTFRRLFQYFFVTYLDQENGELVIRDDQRNTIPEHTTRMANFDAARYLCQWSRLAKVIGGTMSTPAPSVPSLPDDLSCLINPTVKNMAYFCIGMKTWVFNIKCL